VIKNLNEFSSHALYFRIYEYIAAGPRDKRFFAQAADILRILAVNKYGGIYMDLDYEIYRADYLVKLFRSYDFIGGVQSEEPYPYPVASNAFFASMKSHPILQLVDSMMVRNLMTEKIPDYVKYPYSKLISVLFNTGPTVLTVAIYKAADVNKDIYLPFRFLFNMNHRDLPITHARDRVYAGLRYSELPIGDDSFLRVVG
jgi:mannosyltransferase OCH1-like enzyme